MTKFIVLGILIVFLGLIYWRLRPYMRIARSILRAVRGTSSEEINKPFETRLRERAGILSSSAKLVRCDSCGTWTPQTKAIKLRSSASFYCSHHCLELAADGVKQKTVGRSSVR